MLVYDKAYISIRNKYILPLTKYNTLYKSLRTMNIKSIICKDFKSVEVLDKDKYKLYYDKDLLAKALLGDIHLFFIRSTLQKEDFRYLNNSNISPCWNLVTFYYYSFFQASLFLRLCHRGNIFLDIDFKKQFEELISSAIGSVIKLNSNMFYEVVIENDEYVLILSTVKDNTHEVVWTKMAELIDELILLSNVKSEELLILKTLKKINSSLSSCYPSKLRNKVNYQPIYGVETLEKRIFPLVEESAWIKEILSFDAKAVINNDNRIANLSASYTKYLDIFCSKLINEYYEIRGNHNGVLSKINEDRINKIVISDIPFSYDI
jgi:hypothetical protein